MGQIANQMALEMIVKMKEKIKEKREEKKKTREYHEEEGRWALSPAYDLTYSYSIGGEHATMVHGNGKDPGMEDVLAVAKHMDMNGNKAQRIAKNIRECVQEKLGKYVVSE